MDFFFSIDDIDHETTSYQSSISVDLIIWYLVVTSLAF